MADHQTEVTKEDCLGCWLAIRGLTMIAELVDEDTAVLAWKIVADVTAAVMAKKEKEEADVGS